MNNRPALSLTFWWDLLVRPGRAFSAYTPDILTPVVLLLALIVVSSGRGYLAVSNPELLTRAMLTTAFGILTAWISLCLLFHAVSLFLGSQGKFLHLASYMALASVPVTLTTLISLLLFRSYPQSWIHTLLGWIGMAWGWPGLFTYFALLHGEKLNPMVAAVFVVIVLALISFGWYLPAMLSL